MGDISFTCMGIFSSSKGISEREIDKLLKGIKTLNSVQRAYIKGLFVQYRSGGITEQEIEKAIRELKSNSGDGIDRRTAETVRGILGDYLQKKYK